VRCFLIPGCRYTYSKSSDSGKITYNQTSLQSPLPVILHEFFEKLRNAAFLTFTFSEKMSFIMRALFLVTYFRLKNIETGIKITNHYLSQKPWPMHLYEMFRNVWKPAAFYLSFSAFSFPYYEGVWFRIPIPSVKNPFPVICIMHNLSRHIKIFVCKHTKLLKKADKKCLLNP